jgi:hypothetical protein
MLLMAAGEVGPLMQQVQVQIFMACRCLIDTPLSCCQQQLCVGVPKAHLRVPCRTDWHSVLLILKHMLTVVCQHVGIAIRYSLAMFEQGMLAVLDMPPDTICLPLSTCFLLGFLPGCPHQSHLTGCAPMFVC